MEFRLLGPVEVVLDDEAKSIAARRQEIVLASLLLAPNRVVSMNRLIDAVWDETPPRTAKSQIQIAISALRCLFGQRGDQVIETRSPGYLIRAADDELDLTRYEILSSRGAAAVAEGRPTEAVHHLRAALALWRGPAAECVESRLVRAAATRLDEHRLSVLHDCLELELQLGRHRDLIGELTSLTAEHPLNEGFRAQLMLALYRSGRQAEALAAYRECRMILNEQLGLDPGEDLSRLERLILTRDPDLDLPETDSGSLHGVLSAMPVPRQLPRAIADFTGRERVLEDIRALLSPLGADDDSLDVAVIALTGRGGVGKTALAIYVAHLMSDIFPDGQLFVQLQGDSRQSAARVLEQFLRAFGIPPEAVPKTVADRAAMYRSLLAQRRVLIVIDGAVTVGEVMPLLPGTRTCAVIVTTRSRFAGLEGVHQIELGAFDEESSLALLARVIGIDRVRNEEGDARTLVQLCEGMPLALRIVAAKLAARPYWRIQRIMRLLEDESRRLDELNLDGFSIRATLSISYESLNENGRRLLRLLGILGATDFSSWIAAPLMNSSNDDAEALLESLIEARLVEATVAADGSVRFYLHDLVRIYAVERLAEVEASAERLAALRRLLGAWLSLVAEAHRRLYGGDFCVLHGIAEVWSASAEIADRLLEDPLAWLWRERAALVAAIVQASEAGLDEYCWDLAATSVTLFESGSYNDDWRSTHESALDAVRAAGNRRGEAALLCSLGTLELAGNLDTASHLFERSLALFEELDDVHGKALAMSGLAFVARLSGHYDLASEHYQRALAGFRDVGDLIGEAHILNSIAQIHIDRQKYDSAESLLGDALALCRNLGARRVTAQTNHKLAELHLRRGYLTQAEESFKSVLKITRDVKDITGRAYALVGLGNTQRCMGQFSRAEVNLHAALDSADQAGDHLARGQALIALAELDCARDRVSSAMARAQEALKALSELGSAAVWRARALELSGRLHERVGRTSAAAQAWRSALDLVGDADPGLADQLARSLARLGEQPS